ncbi:MAG: metallophosphoesterase, partial [Eubacterium sp.]|nr:metallophosphoesterase [Eubacterium sp.]
YQIETTKDLGREKLRIAQITDSHIGATFDGEGFADHLKKIQETHPDILVITGDFVDDSSTREDLYRCATALKDFEAPLGKYFVYGNHDKGYFRNRDFSADDLEAVLSDYAGVEVLTDGVKLVDDKVYIVGRNDFSNKNRVSIDKILSLLDPSKYIVVLDHQPTDFDAEAKTGADLVLCGHTHGGQMLEMKLVGNLMGVNNKVYGMETRDNTTFIVSSGISDWAIGFKTGTESEFCVIDIRQK